MAASIARSRSALRRSLMSWKTKTTPLVRPRASLMGAPLSSIGVSAPPRAMSRVWLASPTTFPSRKTLAAGLWTSRRVCSLTMRKTSASGRPRASASVQPVRRSATAFMNSTRPAASVEMTASPMLFKVVSRESRLRRASASARRLRSMRRPERSGARRPSGRKKRSATTIERATEKSPGPRPPNHTATNTAT